MGGIHGILAPIVVDLSLERKEIVLEVCKWLYSDQHDESYWLPENVCYTCCVCMLSFVGCQDDPRWRDSKYGGDGNARCIDLTLDWCNNHGQYSKEAQRACPASCGLCKGIFVTYSKLRSISLKHFSWAN